MDRLEELQTLHGHTDRVWSVSWSPDGTALASCSGDKSVRIWQREGDGDAWKCTAVLEDSHSKTIRTVAWAPTSKQLVTASFDGTSAIWQARGAAWEQAATLEGHENEVKGVAWSPDGSYLATCGRDRTVWIWESFPQSEFEVSDVKQGHTQDVKMVAWHPRGEVLASCSYDNSIKLWVMDGDDWVCAQTLEGPLAHESTVWCIAFTRDGQHMASCSDDRTVKVWECRFRGAEPAFVLSASISGHHDRTIYSLDWSCDDAYLATGSGTNSIQLFTRAGGDAGPQSSDHPPGSGATEGSPGSLSPEAAANGQGVQEGPQGGSWQEAARVQQAHELDVNCVRWHPHHAWLLASASDDGSIKLWRHTRADAPLQRLQV